MHLTGGSYSIGDVAGTFGGVIIARSNVLLTGEGSATRLRLQDGLTDCNVIWIRGDLQDVTVRDLFINGNAKKQVPWVRVRSEWNGNNGIKIINPAGGTDAEGIFDPTPRHVKVVNCRIEDCVLMAVMAHGTAVEVLDCYFTGSFGSHVVEILGPWCPEIDPCLTWGKNRSYGILPSLHARDFQETGDEERGEDFELGEIAGHRYSSTTALPGADTPERVSAG